MSSLNFKEEINAGINLCWLNTPRQYEANNMRDPNRITQIQTLITRIWQANPDLRYMQLIYLLQSGYSDKHANRGKVEARTDDGFAQVGYDLFSLEDDQLLEYLKEVEHSGVGKS